MFLIRSSRAGCAGRSHRAPSTSRMSSALTSPLTDRDQLRECGVDPDELLERTARETTKARTRAEAVVRAFLDSVDYAAAPTGASLDVD